MAKQLSKPPTQHIYTVSELNKASKSLLNDFFPSIQVEGEISNLSTPSSGHIYFSLKDAQAQIRCAMFKGQNRRLKFTPENGMQIVAQAQVTLYEPRGDYQLVVESLEESGDGKLRQAYEALKLKLADEGLFDKQRKKIIPQLPTCVGVITSPSGAAIRDILTVLKRRFPAIPVILYPISVQGEKAKYEIVQALKVANRLKQCDVIILGRGGGSLEDLWAFNEEIVARALFASEIPIITGIGHEIDFTIADFVADLRAATPSAAAEHAVPDQTAWLQQFKTLESKITQQLQRVLGQKTQALSWLKKRLNQQHPGQKLMRNAQRLDELEFRLVRSIQRRLQYHQLALTTLSNRLQQQSPSLTINPRKLQQAYLEQRLKTALTRKIEKLTQQLTNAGQTLHALSPLATLDRGYALVTDPQSGKIIRSSKQIKKGDTIQTRLAKGLITSLIETIHHD